MSPHGWGIGTQSVVFPLSQSQCQTEIEKFIIKSLSRGDFYLNYKFFIRLLSTGPLFRYSYFVKVFVPSLSPYLSLFVVYGLYIQKEKLCSLVGDFQ